MGTFRSFKRKIIDTIVDTNDTKGWTKHPIIGIIKKNKCTLNAQNMHKY